MGAAPVTTAASGPVVPAPGRRRGARGRLLALVDDPADLFSHPPERISELQLEAAQEMFAEKRAQIPILDRRARDMGVTAIDRLEDIVPLLFSHTTYKSYPNALVQKGRWDQLLKWLSTLSAVPVDRVDVSGVVDIDDWLNRLAAAGHHPVTSSGTSGKVSILDRSEADIDLLYAVYPRMVCWPNCPAPAQDRHYFELGPRHGYYAAVTGSAVRAALYGRPDSIHYLSDEPLLVAEVSRMAAMHVAMAAGTLPPSEIRAFEDRTAQQAAQMQRRFADIAEKIIALRHEPLFVCGLWSQVWALMQAAKAQGVEAGDFHPDMALGVAGGLKGLILPPDYQQQIFDFFGQPPHRYNSYGMSELATSFPRCEAGRYHQPPWTIPLLLNGPGDELLNRDGALVRGRFGFLDLTLDGRWGGLISGDEVEIDFGAACVCGRPGPTISPDVKRYVGPGDDDKIGCAGTIDAYIRGAMSE